MTKAGVTFWYLLCTQAAYGDQEAATAPPAVPRESDHTEDRHGPKGTAIEGSSAAAPKSEDGCAATAADPARSPPDTLAEQLLRQLDAVPAIQGVRESYLRAAPKSRASSRHRSASRQADDPRASCRGHDSYESPRADMWTQIFAAMDRKAAANAEAASLGGFSRGFRSSVQLRYLREYMHIFAEELLRLPAPQVEEEPRRSASSSSSLPPVRTKYKHPPRRRK